jgi:hypothetical protein
MTGREIKRPINTSHTRYTAATASCECCTVVGAILVSRRQTTSVGVSRRQLRNGTPRRRAVSWLEHRLLSLCHESLAARKERGSIILTIHAWPDITSTPPKPAALSHNALRSCFARYPILSSSCVQLWRQTITDNRAGRGKSTQQPKDDM